VPGTPDPCGDARPLPPAPASISFEARIPRPPERRHHRCGAGPTGMATVPGAAMAQASEAEPRRYRIHDRRRVQRRPSVDLAPLLTDADRFARFRRGLSARCGLLSGSGRGACNIPPASEGPERWADGECLRGR
jgi:hypothetical protein